ncbi:kelch repeat-containing protein [Streptomyces sp. NPDC001156]
MQNQGPRLPEGRFGAAGAALDGRRYAVGGCTNTDCSNTVYVFDPRSGAWSRPRTTPRRSAGPRAARSTASLYCAGDNHDYVETGVGYGYDPASNSWQSCRRPPV